MQNQLLQVKTQVAMAIADLHLLQQKKTANEEKVREWMRKAELAVSKGQDDLARNALERFESYRELTESFTQQLEDQHAQVEQLKTALRQLEQKLVEAEGKADLLVAQHRRARAAGRAGDARLAIDTQSRSTAFDRMRRKVQQSEALGRAKADMAADHVAERLTALEREDRIDQLLADLKAKRSAS
jgi:phage shock protein A